MYQLFRRLLSGLTNALSAQVLIGFSIASGLAAALHFWIALFGVSLPVTTGLLLSIAVFFGGAVYLQKRVSAQVHIAWAAFAVWIVGLPLFADLAASVLGFVPLGWMENDRALIIISAICGIVVVGIPLAFAVFSASTISRSSWQSGQVVIGGLMGTLTFALLTAPLCGVFVSALIGLMVGLMGVARLIWGYDQTEATPVDRSIIVAATVQFRWLSFVLPIVVLTTAGVATAGLYRIFQQLIPGAEYVVLVTLGLASFAFACGYLFSGWNLSFRSRSLTISRMKISTAILTIAVTLVAAIAAFPLMISFGLQVNARVISVPLVMLTRLSMIGVFAIPLFYAIGRVANPATGRHSPAVLSFFIVGLGTGLWLSAGIVPIATLLPLAAVFLGGLAVVASLTSAALRTSKSNYATLIVAGAAIAASPWIASRFQPDHAARLLFSSRVAMASQRSDSADILDALDDARLLEIRETQAGIRTAWRVRGSQIQFRLNGVIDGYAATAASVCPKHSAEILPAVIPLVLHDAPTRVATLGLGTGEVLNTILAFPVQEVHSVVSEKAQHTLLIELDALTELTTNDDRLVEHFVDPAIGVRSLPTQLDVIISNPPDSTRPMGVSHFTHAFYQQAANHLAADGVFCQRFKHIDYGPTPFETVMTTLHGVFADVIAVETSPGDMVLVATNSSQGLVRDGLIKRLQRPQVVSALGQAGWDWSLILSQPALRVNSEQPPLENVLPNTVANGAFAFRLPPEMMRWGQKMLELHNQLASRTNRILTWVPKNEDIQEASKRMGESVELHEIIAGFPDEPWSYRQTLKARMTRQPRPPIEDVKNGKITQIAHPVDQRRIDYLKALSRAIKTLDEETIAEVARFTEPYDPMISYFIHHEVASIYARLPQKNPAAEFAHLLHTIYYADGADRSVRNAAKAIMLLAEHPDVLSGPAERWDNMNALLQVLVYRWENRNTIEAQSSEVALNDVEQSLSSLDAGVECLKTWAADAKIEPSLVDGRTKYLARSLVRPLGTYRGELMKHYEKARSMAAQRNDEVGLTPSAN